MEEFTYRTQRFCRTAIQYFRRMRNTHLSDYLVLSRYQIFDTDHDNTVELDVMFMELVNFHIDRIVREHADEVQRRPTRLPALALLISPAGLGRPPLPDATVQPDYIVHIHLQANVQFIGFQTDRSVPSNWKIHTIAHCIAYRE